MAEQQQMQKIIKKLFNPNKQELRLSQLYGRWMVVLQSHNWELLQQLWLQNCQIKYEGIKLLGNIRLPSLRHLNLYQNQFGNQGLIELLQNGPQSITELILNKNNLNFAGLVTSPQSNIWRNLKFLRLSMNPIGCKGIKYLNKSEMNYLQTLQLDYCKINNEGAKHLAKSKMPNLNQLSMIDNKIESQGSLAFNNYETRKVKKWKMNSGLWMVLINASLKMENINYYERYEIDREIKRAIIRKFA